MHHSLQADGTEMSCSGREKILRNIGKCSSGMGDTGMGRSIETAITRGGGKIRAKATENRQKFSQHYNSLT